MLAITNFTSGRLHGSQVFSLKSDCRAVRSFARLMSKNEDIRKVKLLMQRSLSHGAHSPKLSKMVEVLVDHFSEWHPLS
uniref:Uncharacterized protein n=1 Tax=Populus trichocarpa TaxID=3694 RepID=U5FSS5_POPTR